MGKFSNFVKNVGRGIKKGATKLWSFGKNAVEKAGKVIRPIAKVVNTITGYTKNLPGAIGWVSGLLNKGSEGVKNIIDMLPDSAAKNKLDEYRNRVENKGHELIDRGKNIVNKVTPWTNAAHKISEKILSRPNAVNNFSPGIA